MGLREVAGADAALAILRAEIERLAAAAAAVTISIKPIRVEVSGRPPNQYTTEIWYEGNTFRVISCDGYVGLAAGPGRSLDWWPDFQVVEQNEVREIVAALLSAHEFIVRRQEEPGHLGDSQPHGQCGITRPVTVLRGGQPSEDADGEYAES